MPSFSSLYRALTETKSASDRVALLTGYFSTTDAEEAAWSIYFFLGRRTKRLMTAKELEDLSREVAGFPNWLFDESMKVVRDLAETVALILPEPPTQRGCGAIEEPSVAAMMETYILPLAERSFEDRCTAIVLAWESLPSSSRCVYNRLLLGTLRMAVPPDQIVRALSAATGVSPATLTLRLSSAWSPKGESFSSLVASESHDSLMSRPYPFGLPKPFADAFDSLGPIEEWRAEWKWNGIRAQLIRRQGCSFIWSRSDDLIHDRFPDIQRLCDALPNGSVLDGEIIAWGDAGPLGPASLKKGASSGVRVGLVVFDVLEYGGLDIRDRPYRERRTILESIASRAVPATLFDMEVAEIHPGLKSLGPNLFLSVFLESTSWDGLIAARRIAREIQTEGLVLKRLDSPYPAIEGSDAWLTCRVQSLTVDAVLIYAQRGNAPDPSIYAEYTLGVWHEQTLVPVAKALCGLPEEEVITIDAYVKGNTIEKFGPVRTVKAELVFEIEFDEVHASARHKAGLTLRNPRITRWLKDKTPADAANLKSLAYLKGV